MKKVKTIVIILVILFLIPVSAWIFWSFRPDKPLDILVMNKTVLGLEKKEHRAIFWVLLNEKFVKNDGTAYRMEKDYYGFHPVKPLKSRKYEVRRIRLDEVEKLATEYEIAYYSDTYGVFFNEWYRRESSKAKGTLIDGGLTNSDYVFLKTMIEKNKMVIGEYNFFAPPTIGLVRKKTEDLLGIQWSQWIGTAIRELNPKTSKDLPEWVMSLYMKRHNGEWPFSGSGIVLVNELAQQVLVLENGRHLEIPVPEIQTTEFGLGQYDLPASAHYPQWFDIIDARSNDIIAEYKIHVNIEGKSLLDEFGLPSRFPAVIKSSGSSQFLYLAGNYSNYPVRIWNAKLQGIGTFKNIIYNNNKHSMSQFYWTFYVPLISQVLTNYQASLAE